MQDTIQTFYDITKKEVRDLELSTMARDREMEVMEENHRVEVRVYVQKVKHLEYEHKNSLTRISAEDGSMTVAQHTDHVTREAVLREQKVCECGVVVVALLGQPACE